MVIAQNRVVTMHYTLKDEQGETIDSSQGHEPLAYIQGIGNIIPGLEDALEGKTKGDKLEVTIAPEDGYGERQENMVQKVAKSGFQGDEELVVGMQVQVETKNGPAIAMVSEIEGEDVTLDLNHPLAGVTLNFDVEVMDVREATDEELDHGHVHGPGGHHH
ncbi:MAG: peptidylprolyl isomerase [Cyclobacteriaceae bacterium]|nr:peptidylprolyl isomerase [Cyclobacteriaceae bacterium]